MKRGFLLSNQGKFFRKYRYVLYSLGAALMLTVLFLPRGLAFVSDHGSAFQDAPIIIASGIALVLSIYTAIMQRSQAETAGWSTALARVGQLYDLAIEYDEFAALLDEPVDTEGRIIYPMNCLTSKQGMWLSSLLLAFEQVYVAVSSSGTEAQRAWGQYLANQLNKPTLRGYFLRDMHDFSDYHGDFVEFACGHAVSHGHRTRFSGGAIKAEVIDAILGRSLLAPTEPSPKLVVRAVSQGDLPFWRGLYTDCAVKRQMYAIPPMSDDEFLNYLHKPGEAVACLVSVGDEPIGGFTIHKETDTRGTFGILIQRAHRGKGLGRSIIGELEKQAKAMGIWVLRADVYADNLPSIRLLESSGFRSFIWLEKNLAES